jgi:hypothetical protein
LTERDVGNEGVIECAARPIHPGEILRDEFAELGPLASAFARAPDLPVNRVTRISARAARRQRRRRAAAGALFRQLARVESPKAWGSRAVVRRELPIRAFSS